MNLTVSKGKIAAGMDVDALLQDTYLLVVELRQGALVAPGEALVQLCVEQVERVREHLRASGLSQRNIDHISHAQCALLDEAVLSCAEDEQHAGWASEPLQARFFNRHQAGEFLYEDMRDVLREPSPDHHVLTVFQRVLMLGFRGRYRELDDPEREQVLVALGSHVGPFSLSQSVATLIEIQGRFKGLAWLRSPVGHILAAALLLGATWSGLDHVLGDLINSLLPDQG
ncbi:type VI secretion system protein TssL, short form [Pseudomonas viridiflava]|uniref:type VI secretion system protein TssL, short form n=1 Tax=Pseudomonas viridiflava TaxID=33069 RepID=UPI000F02A893|nr:type VI secretion system protein TssL, short form [Pseudomonas viridiflava]